VTREAQPGRWKRLQRILLPIVVAGVAVGAGIAGRAWFDTRDEIDRTETAVRDTRDDLGRTHNHLAVATAQLEAERATMHDELATLDARESNRDAAEDALNVAKGRLAELQAQLDAATTDLDEREARLDALDRCLRGVVEGLNQAAVGDRGAVEATLTEMEGICAEAGAAL
jgi:chromosome segregation ATPase